MKLVPDAFHPGYWGPLLSAHMPRTAYLPVSESFISALQRDSLNVADAERLQSDFSELIQGLSHAMDYLRTDHSTSEGFCPKLNGKLPYDAAWILGRHAPCCYTWNEAMMVLRASSRIHEPTRTSWQGSFCLVVQRWEQIHPANEFRCFISSCRVIAICQRHPDTPYPFLARERDRLVNAMVSFYETHVRPLHPAYAECILDCYLDDSQSVRTLGIDAWSDDALLLFEVSEMEALRAQAAAAFPGQHSDPDGHRQSEAPGEDATGATVSFRSVAQGFAAVPWGWSEKLPLELGDDFLRARIQRNASD
jgi:hypothetical protein